MLPSSINMYKQTVTTISDNFLRVAEILHHRMAGIIMGTKILLLIAFYGIFTFSDRVPLPGLVAVGLLWMAHWWATGTLTATTPMDVPILDILAMMPVSLYISVDWRLSQPKVYGLVLGIAVFYAVVNATRTIRSVQFAAIALVLVSTTVVMMGLVGTDWSSKAKLFSLPQLYGHLPRLIQGIPRSLRGGFSPNGIGGTLIFVIPVLLSLLWSGRPTTRIKKTNDNRLLHIWWTWYRPILVLSLLLTTFMLTLTQSRGSFIGISVGLLALATWYDRRALWAIPIIALVLFVLFKSGRGGELTQFVLRVDAGSYTVRRRMEVWQRAVYMIQGFPFTGIGLNTFDKVANVLYPFFPIGPNAQVPHDAHNELLQVAVDLGIPGLVGYVALLTTFALTAWRAYHALNDRWLRALIMGLACGMLAHQVFGLTDAFLLGTKPGVVMWVFMGLIAALYVHRDSIARQLSGNEGAEAEGEGGNGWECINGSSGWLSSRLGHLLSALGCWALFSLLAIAVVGDQPYLGLVIALAGSVVLGFVCMKHFESVTA
jgi:putative inorganic carbon (HCO3(-)) transporter